MSAPELHWSKSSYSSGPEPGDCVEIAVTPGALHVRDSKTPETPHLTVTPVTWSAFLGGVSR